MTLILIVVIAYLIGSLPVLSFLRGQGRIPRVTSFPPTGMRPGRGGREGLTLLGLQMGKGALATLAGLGLAGWSGGALAAAAVVLGDLFPVFQGFHGGSGAAVAAGALLILSPLLIVLGLGVYLMTLFLTRYFSLSLFFASIGVMLFALVLFPGLYVVLVVFFAGGLILLRHKGDLDRWHKGREAPVWRRGLRRWR